MARRAKQVPPNDAADAYPELQPHEYAFFPKNAVRVGTRFICHGRRDPGSHWKVDRIETVDMSIPGTTRIVSVQTTRKLADLVYITRERTDPSVPNRQRKTFGAMCYSAIWWITR